MKRDYWVDEFRPSQDREELSSLLAAVAPSEPKVVLEVGVYRCGLLRVFKEELAPDLLVGVDDTAQPLVWNRGVEDAVLVAPADSHDPETVERVREVLDGREVELLFIDGGHTYEDVRQDFEMYAPLVRDGGWVALHDIAFGPDLGAGLVPEFWREVRDRYESREFVRDTGIGLLRWKS